MKDELIAFETAVLAKEKGFNISQAKGYYTHGNTQLVLWVDSEDYNNQKDFLALAPTQSLLQRWLREVHLIHLEIYTNILREWYFSGYDLSDKRCAEIPELYNSGKDLKEDSYEQALEKALFGALKLIK